MRKTTTLQIKNAIKNNILILIKSEIYNKTTQETEIIPNDIFLESFDYFCESNFFMDAIGWHFERNFKTKKYEIEAGRMDGSVDVIVAADFRKNDGVNEEDVNGMLLKIDDEEE